MIKRLAKEFAFHAFCLIAALGLYMYLLPEKSETRDLSDQISAVSANISTLKNADILPLLSDSWMKTILIADFFGVSVEVDRKEALNGSISAEQNAFYGRLSSKTSMPALSVSWLLEKAVPVTIQSVDISSSGTSVSIAVLGRDK